MSNYAVSINGTWVRIAGAFTADDQNYPANWLDLSTPQDRAARNIQAYAPVGAPPAGQRSLGKIMVDDNGSPKEIHQLEDIPLDERKAKLIAEVDAERDRRQQLDFAYDFGDTIAINDFGQEIEAGVRALQMRKDPDQQNWDVLQGVALGAVISGQPGAVIPMRAEDNWNIQSPATQVLAALQAMVERNASMLFFGGGMKSAVKAAANGSALDAIDINVGWPT